MASQGQQGAGPDQGSAAGPKDESYSIKRISFLGRDNVPIFVQNRNGPCPLLGLLNCLSLRNQLDIPANSTSLSTTRLISMVAEKLLDSSASCSGASAEYEANLRANIADCLEVLQKLSTGVDVNIRFNSPTSFEPTREVAVFDLLGVNLMHGWLVDPHDEPAFEALGSRSYNEVVELVVTHLDHHTTAATTSSPPAPAAAPAGGQAGDVGDLLGLEELSIGAPGEGAAAVPSPAASLGHQGSAPVAAPADPLDLLFGGGEAPPADAGVEAAGAGAGLRVQAQAADEAGPGPSGAPQAQQEAPAQPPATSQEQQKQDPDAARKALDAVVAHAFLEAHASQLTVFGIAAINETMRENSLAVFFRNNHFSTLFKHNHALYLLATDAGYLKERDVVWERLDGVDGDTQLCDANFQPYVAPPPSLGHGGLTEIPPEALQGLSEADAAAIAEAAGIVPPPRPPASMHPQGGEEDPDMEAARRAQADADMALAIALQQEEEEREEQARREEERRRAAEAAAQQQGQGQGQQTRSQHRQQPPPQQGQYQQYPQQGQYAQQQGQYQQYPQQAQYAQQQGQQQYAGYAGAGGYPQQGQAQYGYPQQGQVRPQFQQPPRAAGVAPPGRMPAPPQPPKKEESSCVVM